MNDHKTVGDLLAELEFLEKEEQKLVKAYYAACEKSSIVRGRIWGLRSEKAPK